MDIHAAFEEVARWCARQTAARDPDAVEVDAFATVWITIGECAPPWRVRYANRCTSGGATPIAQLRFDLDRREWTLHHGGGPGKGWCDEDDAERASEVGPLLAAIASDRDGRFQGFSAELVELLNRRHGRNVRE
jgi:hypothetical protein